MGRTPTRQTNSPEPPTWTASQWTWAYQWLKAHPPLATATAYEVLRIMMRDTCAWSSHREKAANVRPRGMTLKLEHEPLITELLRVYRRPLAILRQPHTPGDGTDA